MLTSADDDWLSICFHVAASFASKPLHFRFLHLITPVDVEPLPVCDSLEFARGGVAGKHE